MVSCHKQFCRVWHIFIGFHANPRILPDFGEDSEKESLSRAKVSVSFVLAITGVSGIPRAGTIGTKHLGPNDKKQNYNFETIFIELKTKTYYLNVLGEYVPEKKYIVI